MTPGFIYCLHFDRPIHHAQHYLGSTRNLEDRLIAHANGYGSRLCRAAKKRGIRWTVGGLYVVKSIEELRRKEMSCKDQHSAKKHCLVCNPTNRIPGCLAIDPETAGIPPTSDAYRKVAFSSINIRAINPKNTTDIEYITWLMGVERRCVGWMPAGEKQESKGGLNYLAERGKALIAERDGNAAGYCLWQMTQDHEIGRVYQLAVEDRYRLTGVGDALVRAAAILMSNADAKHVEAHVREDLPARGFWTSTGFSECREYKNRQSGNRMIVHTIPIGEIRKDKS